MRVTCWRAWLTAVAALGLLSCEGGIRPQQTASTNAPREEHPGNGSVAMDDTPPDYLPERVDTKGMNPLEMPNKNVAGYANPFPVGSYENFAAQKEYPVTSKVYADELLLSHITATNSKIIICLPQQRARLYVYGRVAMDWPVSTGTDGHETPTGVFRIMEKSRSHHSARYGKWVNDRGRVIDGNADLARGTPDGASFRPSSMPCWQRLTWDGVGLHGGRVIPGRRLSHGCIRTPFATARKLYEHTVLGLPVYISRAVEDYTSGGNVLPEDVKYRPGGDYRDLPPSRLRTAHR